MSIDPRARHRWKKELAALACGLLLGSLWEAAYAHRADPPPSIERT